MTVAWEGTEFGEHGDYPLAKFPSLHAKADTDLSMLP